MSSSAPACGRVTDTTRRSGRSPTVSSTAPATSPMACEATGCSETALAKAGPLTGPSRHGRIRPERVLPSTSIDAPRAVASHPVDGERIQVPANCELTLGMRCVDKSVPGRTVWRMRADERFANPTGILQGGFIGAMADSAMGSAVITFARDAGRRVVASNVEMKTSFLAPVRSEGELECRASVVSGGSRVAFAEAEVIDDRGRTVARASSTYLFSDRD